MREKNPYRFARRFNEWIRNFRLKRKSRLMNIPVGLLSRPFGHLLLHSLSSLSVCISFGEVSIGVCLIGAGMDLAGGGY